MNDTLTILVGIALVATGLRAQNDPNPKVVCQGEYSAIGTDAGGRANAKPIDHWHMDSNQDGSYSVVVNLATSVGDAKVEERHPLTKEMKPSGLVTVMSNGAGAGRRSMNVDCDYGATELSCHTVIKGISAAVRIPQKLPYVFWPTAEAPTFDFPWMLQALASQAERVIGHKTAVPVITLDDGEIENTITLKVQEIEHIEYLGLETVEVLGQKIRAHKFQLPDSAEAGDVAEFWISQSGILLSSRMDEEDGATINLTKYQGPPLGP